MRFTIAVVAVGALVGRAAAELPPPPPGPTTGAGRTVAKFLELYYGYSRDPDFCIRSMRSAADAFTRNRATIADLGPAGAELGAYLDQHLGPYFAPQWEGVPGFGTYAEVAARREATAAWIRANVPPSTPIASVADAERYAAAENAFFEKVEAERAWTEALFAAGPCVRYFANHSNLDPQLGDFGAFRHWIGDASIAQMVIDARTKAFPRIDGHARGASTLTHHVKGPFATASALGDALGMVVGSVRDIDADEPRVALYQTLADRLRRGAAPIAQAMAQRTQIRARLVEWFQVSFPRMGVWPAVKDGAAAPLVKAWAKRAGKVVASRVTDRMAGFDEVRSEFAGNHYLRPVRFRGKTFGFQVVFAGPPWDGWPSMGIPAAEICHSLSVSAVRYDAGADVELGRWVYHLGTTNPIPCANKERVYTP